MLSAQLENQLNESFINHYPNEAVKLLEGHEETLDIIQSLSLATNLILISKMTPIYVSKIISQLPKQLQLDILNNIDVNTCARILSYFPPNIAESIFQSLKDGVAEDIKVILNYPPDSVGSMMDPKVLGVHGTMMVKHVLSIIDEQHRKGTRLLFLIDEEQKYHSAITIQDLALANHESLLLDLPKTIVASIGATEPLENAVEIFEKYKITDLPVVDSNGILIGVIRYSKFINAIQEDATAPLQTMVGVSKEEKALSSISFAIKKRLPWLQINLLTAFLAAATVGLFESTIQKYVALAVLLPVVAGQSGNTGAQALAVTMRGLALREIRIRQWKRVIFKETMVGFINGIGIAITCSLIVALWSKSIGLTIIIFTSMILSMVIAGMSGAIIPILLKKLGQDPAQSSTIILTTVTDVTGFFSFLAIATLLARLI